MNNENSKSRPKVRFADAINHAIHQLIIQTEKEAEEGGPDRRTQIYLRGLFKIQVIQAQVLAEMAEKQGISIR